MTENDRYGQAAVFHGAGQPLEIQRFRLPELSDGEALVRIECCTLCRSDLHTIGGKRAASTPMILGHEVLGRLVAAPAPLFDLNGQPVQAGDRISWSIIVACEQCYYCQHGLPQKCMRLYKYGHQVFDAERPFSGGLATHCQLVRNTSLIRVPDTLPDHVACPVNCATATTAAAWRMAGSLRDTSIVIIGAGMLGLTAAAMAHHLGASQIHVTDIDLRRADFARQFGGNQTDLNRFLDRTDGRGADLVLDTSGSPDAIVQALKYLRIGGQLIMLGAVHPGRPLSIRADDIVRRMLRIVGVHNYAPADLQCALEFLAATCHQFPFDQLVPREYCLQDVNDAVADAMSGNGFRIAIRP
jgi:alcohol dehydrogenase